MPKHATLDGDGKVPLAQLPSGLGGGSSDHGALTGLADDDHTQYHTDARGDARYSALGHNHTGTYQPLATVLTNTTAVFTTAQETKLSGIATAATANSLTGTANQITVSAATGNSTLSLPANVAVTTGLSVGTGAVPSIAALQVRNIPAATGIVVDNSVGIERIQLYSRNITGVSRIESQNSLLQIYTYDVNDMTFGTSDAERMRITSAGAVSVSGAFSAATVTDAGNRVVTTLTAGSGISISGTAPSLTISATGGGSDPWTWTKLASNSVVSTTAYASVSGMSFSAAANTTYLVEVFGAFQTAATTTGIGLAFTVPAGSTIIGGINVNSANTTVQRLMQRASGAVIAVSTGVPTANTNIPIYGYWVIATGGTAGTVQLTQRSEIAASNTTLQAGITIMGYRSI